MNPNKIKSLRKSTKLTQDEFGNLFGVSGAIISRWESGIHTPDPFKQQALRQLETKLNKSNAEAMEKMKELAIAGGIMLFLLWLFKDK